MVMVMENIKIRCSALGKIMTAPRSKSEVLSQTAKTYIEELAKEHLFGIKKVFKSRYTDKGNEVEEKAIELTEEVLGFEFLTKNEDYFENDYIKGTPDIITHSLVIDVKSSWSGDTFPFFETELPNKDYYYQVMGYMWLTGKKNALISYCLINTPEEIVNDEIRRTAWGKYEIEPSEETIREVQSVHNFNHIPKDRRVKAFHVEFNEGVINEMKTRIDECRKYFNTLIK
jgi:predicted transcriptional regulator